MQTCGIVVIERIGGSDPNRLFVHVRLQKHEPIRPAAHHEEHIARLEPTAGFATRIARGGIDGRPQLSGVTADAVRLRRAD